MPSISEATLTASQTPFAPPAILLMKAGFHANEGLEAIIARKRREETIAGTVYWGYGGTLCHPTRQLRPFAEHCAQQGLLITVTMPVTASRFAADPVSAREFSTDGEEWQRLPESVDCRASKWALVMRGLAACHQRLDLNSYIVASGPSQGRRLGEYIRHRVDKACGVHSPAQEISEAPVTLGLIATLVPPYAVFLR